MSVMESVDAQKPHVISGRTIARNTFLNIIGRCIPLVTALFTIPLLIQGFGTERYGLLTLFWIVIGYFGLLDMGIGRTTTKFVADRLASNHVEGLPRLVWTSWALLMGLGVLAGVILVAMVPVLVSHVLNVPQDLREETAASFYWLAGFMPFALSIAGMQGVLEAQQRFDIINGIQIPAAIIGYIIPLVVLRYTQDLSVVIVALLVSRTIVWSAFLSCCLRSIPLLRHRPSLSSRYVKDLLCFGGWLTVSNIVSPLMVYTDRFLIGALLTLSAVAYYTTPYSMVTQLWVIPGSLMPVLFPTFSHLVAQRNAAYALLYRRAVKYIFLAMMPLAVALIVLADDLMSLWVGAEFASHSAPVLALLALGVLINSLAQVPFGLIQAAGRPDVTARFHLLEVLPYFALVWWGIATYGIVGAALAWVTRVAVDAVLLFWFADRLLPDEDRGVAFVVMLPPITAALYGVTAAATWPMGNGMARGAMTVVIMGVAAVSAWRLWLSPGEKAWIMQSKTRILCS